MNVVLEGEKMKKLIKSFLILLIAIIGINGVSAEEFGKLEYHACTCVSDDGWVLTEEKDVSEEIRTYEDRCMNFWGKKIVYDRQNKILRTYECQLKKEPGNETVSEINMCYQCRSSDNVYKWSTNGNSDTACSDGYEERTDISEDACKMLAEFPPSNDNTSTIATVKCGSMEGIPAALPQFIKNIINIVKIAVPIILVIMGMMDFAKAVVSSDEKSMKESQTKFIKRVIAAVVIFLVVTVVQLVFRIINTDDTNEMAACIDCFINGDCSGYSSTPTIESSCYQCNSTGNYIWSTANPGVTKACPSGYHERSDLSESECRDRFMTYSCYRCNSPDNIYKWSYDSAADSACPTGYHQTGLTEDACHS